jgi:succinate dehydrogenase hydrophobic anchor subunit
MSENLMEAKTTSFILRQLERVPYLAFLAKTRGWPFFISWSNRIAGILLVVWVWIHIYFLAFLCTPSAYDNNMTVFRWTIFAFLQWVLAIPVIFHALNGGRLILYEIFGKRNDDTMLRWMFGLSIIYIALLGLFMFLGNQSVSPFFFWLLILVTAIVVGYGVARKIWRSEHSILWKLQRISGAFLLIMVPAHLLFMHLNPSVGMEASVVIKRMQSWFIKAVDLALIVAALYHGGYGLFSVFSEHLSSRILRVALVCLIAVIFLAFAWVGIRLTVTI